jgi:hypothetical protein
MVARIAPSPIGSSVAIGDALAHAAGTAHPTSSLARQHNGSAPAFERHDVAQNNTANTPAPPTPPGEAFAAAVIAGQLPPVPVTPEQLRQRLGAAWQPPTSALRLMDRSA